jgi:hypothetical protein
MVGMKKFFSPNITGTGRLVRGTTGIALIVAGLLISAPGRWICTALVISGGFVLYEAVRGWCLLRACGLRTKL